MCNGAKKCGLWKQLAAPALTTLLVTAYFGNQVRSRDALYIFGAAYVAQWLAANIPNANE
jgi:hypothetical protein